jgi:DNA-binding transcriptional MerR regulator
MAGVSLPIEIPKRTLFKAAEVCDLVKEQPYVLRSWEGEFPELGVATTAGGPRVYRRTDIEQVMRIKHLLLVEGLTLAGARRKLEEEGAPPVAIEELIGPEARNRLTEIKRGLRSILELLSTPGADDGFVLQATEPSVPPPSDSVSPSRPARTRGHRNSAPERAAGSRKRSAS